MGAWFSSDATEDDNDDPNLVVTTSLPDQFLADAHLFVTTLESMRRVVSQEGIADLRVVATESWADAAARRIVMDIMSEYNNNKTIVVSADARHRRRQFGTSEVIVEIVCKVVVKKASPGEETQMEEDRNNTHRFKVFRWEGRAFGGTTDVDVVDELEDDDGADVKWNDASAPPSEVC
eukprot:PhM_4_TR17691/c0_g1_i1/m.24675